MFRLFLLFFLLGFCCEVSGQGVTVTKSTDIVVIRGKSYYLHTVQPGQTFFSICKAYGVDVEEVKKLNEKEGNDLSLYEVLKIPFVEAFVQQDDKYYYHKVEKGETFYSIARLYKMKPKRLMKLNEEYDPNTPLAIGAVVKLPLAEIDLSSLPADRTKGFLSSEQREAEKQLENRSVTDILQEGLMPKQDTETTIPLEEEKEGVDEKVAVPDYISEVVMPTDPFVKVALLLPFSAKEYPTFVDTLVGKLPVHISARSEQFLTFYEGVLLAVDSLKSQGCRIDLKVLDTERSAEKTYLLADQLNSWKPDLIIGPVYGSVYKALIARLDNQNIPVIYPLSSRNEGFGNYPNFIQINPSAEVLTDVMCDWLNEQAKQANLITLNVGGKAESEEMEAFKDRMHQINGMNFYNWSATEMPLNGLRMLLLPDRENILVLPTLQEAQVIKILPVLSALTDDYRITVLGFPEWQTFTSVDHETYFKLNTKLFTYSYVDQAAAVSKHFAVKYRKYFYTEPTNLAYKAFDLGLYFIGLAAKYRDRTLDALEFYPGNEAFSRFYFQKIPNQLGKENRGFFIVNFGSDYRLKMESL